MIDSIEMANNALKQAENCSMEHRDWWQRQATVYASVAQAEQLKRMADAAELRNMLLEQYNAESQANAQRHTESIAQSVSKFVGALYGEGDE